jgi:S1-C subfamily serine protease
MASAKQETTLAELSSRFAGAVEQVAPSVVAIHARRRIPSSGVVWRDGVIVSASHTVRRDGTVRVSLASGDAIDAEIAGRDPSTDLVVLRAASLAAPVAPRADADASRVGSFVLAVGRPGRSVTASFGIVSAEASGVRTASGARLERLLRLDLAVYDGFSGGPLVSPSGGVIGIDNSAFARGGAATLPSSVVDRVVDELLAHGHVRRPFIGIGVHPVALNAATVAEHKLESEAALVVVAVAEGAAAETAGVLLGDVLVGVAGRPLAHPSDLVDALADVPDGASIQLSLLRGGLARSIDVTPGDRAAA